MPSVVVWAKIDLPSASTPATASSGCKADTPAATMRVSKPLHSIEQSDRKGEKIVWGRTGFNDLSHSDHVIGIAEVTRHGQDVSLLGLHTFKGLSVATFLFRFENLGLSATNDADSRTALGISSRHRPSNSGGSSQDQYSFAFLWERDSSGCFLRQEIVYDEE